MKHIFLCTPGAVLRASGRTLGRFGAMRWAWVLCLCAGLPLAAQAGEAIGPADSGTYAVIGKNGQLTAMRLRLSRQEDAWVLEGKEGEAPWQDFSCEGGCEYQASPPARAQAYLASFPPPMPQEFNIDCIESRANAFCRLSLKEAPAKGGYALVTLVTGKPVSLALHRLQYQAPATPQPEPDVPK